MATPQNKHRKRERRPSDPLWGSLMQPEREEEDTVTSLPPPHHYEEPAYVNEEEPPQPLWREMWHHFSFWSMLATFIFLVFTGGIAWLTMQMWTPQDTHDIAGYTDKGTARDLLVALRQANGAEVIFTEGELNRYLRDTCRLRQTGIFSVLAHAQGVAVRLHDGYAEIIIDRVLSTHFHQTTAVHIAMERETDHGRPKLRAEFRGGSPILGSMPRGGRIGCVGIPQRFIQMLQPALDTLQDCYPDIIELIETTGYCPEFNAGRDGQEGYVRLVPYTPQDATM